MTRLVVAVVVGMLLCVVALRVAGTVWVIPLGFVAVAYALVCSFLDDRAQRDLQTFERKERLRDEKHRRAA